MRRPLALMATALVFALAGSASAEKVFYYQDSPRGLYYFDTADGNRVLLSDPTNAAQGAIPIGNVYTIAVENANSLLVYGETNSGPPARGIYRIDRTTGNRELVSGESFFGPPFVRGAAAVPSPSPFTENFSSDRLGAIMVDPTNSNRLLIGSYAIGSLEVALDTGNRGWFTSAFTSPNFGTGDAPTFYQAHLYRNSSSIYLYDSFSGMYAVELATGNRTRIIANTTLPIGYIANNGHAYTPAESGDIFYFAPEFDGGPPRLVTVDLANPAIPTVISRSEAAPTIIGTGPSFSNGMKWIGRRDDGNIIAHVTDFSANQGFMLIDVATGNRSWLSFDVDAVGTGEPVRIFFGTGKPHLPIVIERTVTSVPHWTED